MASNATLAHSVQLVGRTSSHFTRVATIVAHELGVPFQLIVVADLTSRDQHLYGGHPALKIPVLRMESSELYGAENICRKLAELSGASLRVVWPEQITDDLGRNAQELVWNAMAAEVQLVFGTGFAKLPPENIYFEKGRAGLLGALHWLEGNLTNVLGVLPTARDLSLLEVTLFCLLEHLVFSRTVAIDGFPGLMAFAADFGSRPSAQRTKYRLQTPNQEKPE